MAVGKVSDADFEAEVLKATGPVVVDFWAEWCGPCRMIAPALDEISGAMGDKVKIVKLNVDESPKTASKYGVMSIPTLMIFKGGEMASGQFEDRVARVRRAGFDDMRKRMAVAIAGRADAAGIDDHPPVAKPDRARDVAVGAQYQRLRDSFGHLLDSIQRCHANAALGKHGFQPIDFVARWRGVAEEHAVAVDARRRHRTQPVEVDLIELRMRRAVQRA